VLVQSSTVKPFASVGQMRSETLLILGVKPRSGREMLNGLVCEMYLNTDN
jgi:hypothetical protein